MFHNILLKFSTCVLLRSCSSPLHLQFWTGIECIDCDLPGQSEASPIVRTYKHNTNICYMIIILNLQTQHKYMLHIYNLKELHYHTKSVHWNSPLPAGLVKGLLDALEAFTAFQPGLDFSRLTGRRQAHHRPPGHSICKNTTTGTTCQLWKSHSWQSIRLMCFRYYAILYQFKWLWNEFAFRYPSRAKKSFREN